MLMHWAQVVSVVRYHHDGWNQKWRSRFSVPDKIIAFQCCAFGFGWSSASENKNILQMCNWTRVLTIVSIVYLECVLAYSRRGPFRVYRKASSPPFPAHLLSLPPPRAAAQNFNAAYELPPFMMMPSIAPPSTSYGEPIMQYGPPRPEFSPPRQEYGPPRQEYGPPSTTMKPVIHKHIYVHIPPPEPDHSTTRQ